ncbi:hypothetical protein [Burkholderia phage BCSR5]|nr:hypothetical protein [Burkholderia phage BCSR5]
MKIEAAARLKAANELLAAPKDKTAPKGGPGPKPRDRTAPSGGMSTYKKRGEPPAYNKEGKKVKRI